MSNNEVESRLRSLERRLNRYRLAASLLGAAVVGLAGIAANAPEKVANELKARKIVVVDEQGKEAAHLTAGPHGGVLNIHNRSGLAVVLLGASEKGGQVTVADSQGAHCVTVIGEEAGGQINLTDQKGQRNQLTAGSSKH